MARRALITGITGQDGSYLAELLLEQGYEVHGVARHPEEERPRLRSVRDRVTLHRGDLLDQGSLIGALHACEPEEIYNFAAMSGVAASWDQAVLTAEITGLGVARMLEAMREVCPEARFCQASSSEMFGRAGEPPQDELTPFHPRSPYGAAKAYGHFMTTNYRESYGLFACSAILFNHESPRRGLEFVTRKVSHAAASIKLGLASELRLGDMGVRRDWGFAPDYVEAMRRMLQQDTPEDLVIGTGEDHSVRELVEIAFDQVDLDPAEYVVHDPMFIRAAESDRLVANSSRAQEKLGWRPTLDFNRLVRLMVEADLALLRT